MPRILLLGPVPERLADKLREVGHRVERLPADRARAVVQVFGGLPPDLLTVDLREERDALPLRKFRALFRDTWNEELRIPCLALLTPQRLLSPNLSEDVDEFVLPPYDPIEACARVSHLLQKSFRVRDSNRINFADITLDLSNYSVRDAAGKTLQLTPRELELLRFLCVHRGRFFDRDRLLTLVWGVGFEGSGRAVDIHICRLRAKLPPQAASRLQTLRGVGYGFKEDV